MIINKLDLINFRNYNNETFNFEKNINLIIGNNGNGKTNVIESIYACCYRKVF